MFGERLFEVDKLVSFVFKCNLLNKIKHTYNYFTSRYGFSQTIQ